MAVIRRLVDQAAGRIEVLPAVLAPAHLAEVVRETGVDQVHLSLRRPVADPSAQGNPRVRFGGELPASEAEYRAVDEAAVRRVRVALDALGGEAA
jgi:copper homeostasis protein CutC